jgi:hypothetical protein
VRIASSRFRVTVALAAGLFFYALSDVLLWQRIFEQHDLFQFDKQYQTGHAATLVGFLAIGMVLLLDTGWWALWYGAAFFTLSFSGLEDALYYWLDGRPIPDRLPWLDNRHPLIIGHPVTAESVVLSSAIWIVLWGASLALLPRIPRQVRRVLNTTVSAIDRLAIIPVASQLAAVSPRRQLRAGAVGLALVLALGSGIWFVGGTIGSRTPTVGLSAASDARLSQIPDIVGPGQTADRFSTWPANCRTAVVILDFRDKSGAILHTDYIYLTPGGSLSLGSYAITSGVAQISTHFDCADNWPSRVMDTRAASA